MARRVGYRAYAPRRKSSRAIVRSDCGAPLMVTSYARGPARLTPAAPAGAARASPPSASTTTSARRIVTPRAWIVRPITPARIAADGTGRLRAPAAAGGPRDRRVVRSRLGARPAGGPRTVRAHRARTWPRPRPGSSGPAAALAPRSLGRPRRPGRVRVVQPGRSDRPRSLVVPHRGPLRARADLPERDACPSRGDR